MNMVVYQMDVKTAFLNAPRAWYDMLSSFLISNDFSKGSVDPTLFIRREGKELLLVQIYVDDIIFAASTPELCDLFAKIMKSKLDEDKEGKVVDPSHYRGMIGTLLYLTASRPDLQFAICMCARYQARPTEKHLNAHLADAIAWLGCQDTRLSTSANAEVCLGSEKDQIERHLEECRLMRSLGKVSLVENWFGGEPSV
ncbi:retrovirus-related pol polyprotein from transposon TNT 1-94 [Tanacetum coccineum]